MVMCAQKCIKCMLKNKSGPVSCDKESIRVRKGNGGLQKKDLCCPKGKKGYCTDKIKCKESDSPPSASHVPKGHEGSTYISDDQVSVECAPNDDGTVTLSEQSHSEMKEVLDIVLETCTDKMKHFLSEQVRNAQRKPNARRWSMSTISAMLPIYCRSKASYEQFAKVTFCVYQVEKHYKCTRMQFIKNQVLMKVCLSGCTLRQKRSKYSIKVDCHLMKYISKTTFICNADMMDFRLQALLIWENSVTL